MDADADVDVVDVGMDMRVWRFEVGLGDRVIHGM